MLNLSPTTTPEYSQYNLYTLYTIELSNHADMNSCVVNGCTLHGNETPVSPYVDIPLLPLVYPYFVAVLLYKIITTFYIAKLKFLYLSSIILNEKTYRPHFLRFFHQKRFVRHPTYNLIFLRFIFAGIFHLPTSFPLISNRPVKCLRFGRFIQ